MFSVFPTLNWTAVAVAAVTSFVLGGLWFTVLFGRAYAAALGKAHEPGGKPGLLFIAGPFVCGCFSTLASAVLVDALKLHTMGDAVAFGAVVGLGFLAATCVNTAINPNMPRPLFYGFVSGSYFFLSGIVNSAILVALR